MIIARIHVIFGGRLDPAIEPFYCLYGHRWIFCTVASSLVCIMDSGATLPCFTRAWSAGMVILGQFWPFLDFIGQFWHFFYFICSELLYILLLFNTNNLRYQWPSYNNFEKSSFLGIFVDLFWIYRPILTFFGLYMEWTAIYSCSTLQYKYFELSMTFLS